MPQPDADEKSFSDLLPENEPVSTYDEQIAQLERQLEHERDARREERFVFIVVCVVLLDVVFFSVMPSFGGPLALLVLQLLVLIPLARRMGMEEVARILSRVLDRVASKGEEGE